VALAPHPCNSPGNRSRAAAAAAVGVGEKSVQYGIRVLGYGTALESAVDAAKLSLKRANDLTYLPNVEQEVAANLAMSGDKQGKAELKKLVAKAKAKRSPGKARKPRQNTSTLVVDTVKNINKLVALMEASEVGITDMRDRIVRNLKVARKYIKETEPYLV